MSGIISGKGNLLDAVRDFDPNLTGEYVRLRGDDPQFHERAIEFMGQIQEKYSRSGFLLRSDASCEDGSLDGKLASFAGAFSSVEVTSNDIMDKKVQIEKPLKIAARGREHLLELLREMEGEIEQDYKRASLELRKALDRVEKGTDSEYEEYNIRTLENCLTRENQIEKAISHTKNMQDTDRLFRGIEKVVVAGKKLNVFAIDENANEKYTELLRQAKVLSDYSQSRGVSLSEARMDFILARSYREFVYADYFTPPTERIGATVLIAEHPNMIGKLHVEDVPDSAGGVAYTDISPDQIKERLSDLNVAYLAQQFYEVITALRSKGKLNPGLVYMAEGLSRNRKIVQLRPWFPQTYTPSHIPEVFGTLPEEGFQFSLNEHGGYTGLEVVNMFRKDSRSHEKKEGKVFLGYSRSPRESSEWISFRPFVLSHVGLRTAERFTTLDFSKGAFESFQQVKGASTIRYYQQQDGKRRFEAVQK